MSSAFGVYLGLVFGLGLVSGVSFRLVWGFVGTGLGFVWGCLKVCLGLASG